MAWIESHQELGRHPKTRKAARLLGISQVCVVGHLHFLWWWALDFAQEGSLSRYDAQEIADAAMWEGDAETFIHALCDAGFIDGEQGSYSLHDWYDCAGKLIDKRKANADRMRAARAADSKPRATDVSDTFNTRAEHVQRTFDARAGATVPYRTEPNHTDTNVEAARSSSRHANHTASAVPASAGELIRFPVDVQRVSSETPAQEPDDPPSEQTVYALPARNRGEKELDYWLRVVNEAPSSRRVALLVRIAHDKLDVTDEPGGAGYQRIGTLARKHGAGMMVRNLFTAAAQHVDGDPLDYITVISDRAKARKTAAASRAATEPTAAPQTARTAANSSPYKRAGPMTGTD